LLGTFCVFFTWRFQRQLSKRYRDSDCTLECPCLCSSFESLGIVRQPFDCVARQAWGADCRFVLCTDVLVAPFFSASDASKCFAIWLAALNDYNSEQPKWEERLGISWHQPTRVLWPIQIQTCQYSLIGCDYCTVRVTFRHQLSRRKLTHVLFSKCRHLYATGDFSGPW